MNNTPTTDIKYQVIVKTNITDLVNHINTLINTKEWTVTGGICIMVRNDGTVGYYQAMIKKDN